MPIISQTFGFCQSFSTGPVRLTTGLWTVPFRRFADLIKDNQKARLNALTCVRPCLFLLSLICQVCRRTLYLQTHCLAGVARRGVRRATRSAMNLLLPAIIMQVLHALQDVMHVFTAQLAFSLCGLLGFVHIVLGQHGHRLQ